MTLRDYVRRAERALVHALLVVLPSRGHVVINGSPLNEGNAVEMVRVCAERYPGRIVWLVPDATAARALLDAVNADPAHRVEIVAHRSLAGAVKFATAEVSMFTHGLYGNPRRARRKTMVNLWHGGGFKASVMSDQNGNPSIHSDYLVTATAQFGRERAEECKLPAGGLLLTGNPRIDQFARSESAPIERLGIRRDVPFVLWMPTFRRNKGRGLTGGWSDAVGGVDINQEMAEIAGILDREYGIRVVVKPHAQDEQSRVIEQAVTVTDDDLLAAGVQLYELLGASSGLLTDYSSVWVDYLVLDRPIGFIVPDEAEYRRGRGFRPSDALDWLPGDRLCTENYVREFAHDVRSGGRGSVDRRRAVADHIGYCSRLGAANRVLDELERRNVFRFPLRPGAGQLPNGSCSSQSTVYSSE